MKRYRIAAVLAAALMLTGHAALAQSARIATGGGALNMRKEASQKSNIVQKIDNGAQVEILSAEGEWSRIEYKGKKGYVKTEFLDGVQSASGGEGTDGEGTDGGAAAQEQKTAQNAKSSGKPMLQRGGFAFIRTGSGALNMRRKADSKSHTVTQVENGARVGVLEADTVWTQIEHKGKKGYVKTEYLLLDAQAVGRTVYPDSAYLYLLEGMEETADSSATVHGAQGMKILEMHEEYAKVHVSDEICGDAQGYVPLSAISTWREEPDPALGEVLHARLTAQKENDAPGVPADLTLVAPEGAVLTLSVERDGETLLRDVPLAERMFSYLPRESGAYRVSVHAAMADGREIGCMTSFTVSGDAAQDSPVYSQKSGGWKSVKYGRSQMEQSGCAIFAVSHALELLGLGDGENNLPGALAAAYPMYLTDSGTVTSGLVNAAARDFGFKTMEDKIHKPDKIAQEFERGAVFSFSVCKGHIALAAALDAEYGMVKILDSAPSATFARIENAQLYVKAEDGEYRAAQSLWDIPGARYYPETGEFGGLTYYLTMDYCAKRGLRLMRPKE